MLRLLSFISLTTVTTLVLSAPALAKTQKPFYWYTTHSIEKFPCMNEKETAFLKRVMDMDKIEEKNTLLSDHRKESRPSSRHPASIRPSVVNNQRYICPPFKGVRNPHPQPLEFGKASLFERILITDHSMTILNGLFHDQKWDHSFNPKKGYYEGKTLKGTPTNLIPLSADTNGSVRFFVQYYLWDKTPPTLTFCYREDLHSQCNPYKDPALKSQAAVAPNRAPASASKP